MIKQPADKSHFILPDLGEGVHEAELIRWLVEPGQAVEEHDILAEMETDKAQVEVPSPWRGVIKELHGKPGDILDVGSVLVSYQGTIGADSGEPSAAAAAAKVVESATEANGDAGTVVGNMETGLSVSERFTRRQPETAAAGAAGKALATPAVRRIARDVGIDINLVPATGRGGRVTAGDVQAYVSGHEGRAVVTQAPTGVSPGTATTLVGADVSADGVARTVPFIGVRRKIAEALDRSIRTAVHFTVTDEADVTALDRKRKEYAAVTGSRMSFLPLIMTAVCRALRRHPTVNANMDDANNQILIKDVINLGIAVDTDHGLMVPVIKAADTLSMTAMSDHVASAARRCRDRSIPREELVGGTFTISNVGSFGGLHATPIINYPEVAIIAVGRVVEQVLTRNGAFYAGKVMPLSMSCDHRVVDGAEGARFLSTVRVLLESPEKLIGG